MKKTSLWDPENVEKKEDKTTKVAKTSQIRNFFKPMSGVSDSKKNWRQT